MSTWVATCLFSQHRQYLLDAYDATQQLGGLLYRLPGEPRGALWEIWTADPLVLAEALALCAAALSWVWYLFTHNCSHVDRLW